MKAILNALLTRSRPRSSAAAAKSVTPGTLLRYGAWFASVVSLGEILYWTRAAYLKYKVPPTQYPWWIPLGNVLVFTAVLLLLMLVVRKRAGTRPYVAVVSVLTCSLALAWIVVTAKVAPWAAWTLAIGVAVQAGRIAGTHSCLVDAVLRKSLGVMMTAIVAVAAGSWMAPHLRERQVLAALPQPLPGAPNVLLLVLDTVRAKSLGTYGYARAETATLDGIGGRGIVFERAFSTSPWTLPSHSSMFTGRWPHEVTAAFLAPLDGTYPTLAEVLSQNGYETAAFTANQSYTDREFGLARGFAHFEGRRTTPVVALRQATIGRLFADSINLTDYLGHEEKYASKTAARINTDFLEWLTSRDRPRPFFAFLNYFDAHAPYLVRDDIRSRFTSMPPMLREEADLRNLSAEEIKGLNDSYDATLAYLDAELGRLFAGLEALGQLENTVVVITSDHGEQFGEHRMMLHSSSLYTQVLHVPLMISYPGQVPEDVRVPQFVSLRDLSATIFDLSGVTQPPDFPGASLREYWGSNSKNISDRPLLSEVTRTHAPLPEWYPAGKGAMKSIVFQGRHYIRNYGDGREELYDLSVDREEMTDLAPSHPELLPAYRERLAQVLRATN
jgi:arylsulfatase A-like enzyme